MQILYIVGILFFMVFPSCLYMQSGTDVVAMVMGMIFALPIAYLLSSFRSKWVRFVCISLLFVILSGELITLTAYNEFINASELIGFLSFNSLETNSTIHYLYRYKSIYYLIALALYICLSVIGWVMKPLQRTMRGINVSIAMIVVGIICSFVTHKPYMPYNIIRESVYAMRIEMMHVSSKQTLRNNVCVQLSHRSKELYVLAIGESVRYDHLSIEPNDYERETMPQLSKMNPCLYSDCYSTGTFTQQSVPMILTPAKADCFVDAYRLPTLSDIFHSAGFTTYIISHCGQVMNTRICKHLASGADSIIFVSSDREVLTTFEHIAEKEENAFVILHFLGNHFLYSNYPRVYNRWQPNYTYHFNQASDSLFINAYDNSLLYTDSLLAASISCLKDRISAWVFLSDHGEYIDSHTGGHGFSYHPCKAEYHIPLMVWHSDEYKEAYPDKVANLIKHKDEPVCADNAFWSVLDMADIRIDSTLQQEGMSIFGDTLLPHQRALLLPDGRSVMMLD